MGGSPPLHGAATIGDILSVCLSELRGPDRSGVTHGVGDGVEVAAVVTVGDPHGLAVTEAGSGGEAHRVGVGCFGILQGQGAGGQYPNHTRNSPASTPPKAAVVP